MTGLNNILAPIQGVSSYDFHKQNLQLTHSNILYQYEDNMKSNFDFSYFIDFVGKVGRFIADQSIGTSELLRNDSHLACSQ